MPVSATYLDLGGTIPLRLRVAGAEMDAELDVEDDNTPAPPPLNGDDDPAFNTPLPSGDPDTDTDPTLLPLPTPALPALGGLIADFNGPPDALLAVLVRTYGVIVVVVVMRDMVLLVEGGRDALATDAMEGVRDVGVVEVEPVDAVLERSIGLVIVEFGREGQRGRGRAVGVFAFAFVLGPGIDEDAAEAFDTTRDLPGVGKPDCTCPCPCTRKDDEECVLRNDAVDDVLLTDEIDVLLNDETDPVLFSNGGSAFEGGLGAGAGSTLPGPEGEGKMLIDVEPLEMVRIAGVLGAEAEPDLARIEVFSCPFGAIVHPPPGPPVPTAPAPAPPPIRFPGFASNNAFNPPGLCDRAESVRIVTPFARGV
ncbi:hypothetical protein BU17DRAFT_95539 [Hysterangium stoloniferum]|nr:hypothetical protein BU17DRAFT_95539 [Hysterangium stoloniferum]